MVRSLIRYSLLALALLLALLYTLSRNWPEPAVWHTADLDEEFSVARSAEVRDYADYLALEERLFRQLDREVYANTPSGPEHAIDRYSRDSTADPTNREKNWNRSFELGAANPRGGVLLLHGMSDSPYSLRALGLALNGAGYQVLGLRLPGHGTAPSGLTRFQWQDMAAAVRLAMSHLSSELGGAPLHMIGYSNGAPLALNYALDAELDQGLQQAASLVLISPAVGISPAAVMAQWTRRLSYLPGLEHLAWLDMFAEFDPYKYNSFASNAAEQVRLLTLSIAKRFADRPRDASAPEFPPILALKSTVDATVSTHAVVNNLLRHLDSGRNELVLFDINRRNAISSILVSDPGPLTNELLRDASLPFTLTVVGNESSDSVEVAARRKAPYSVEIIESDPIDAAWPAGVISLSHIALPFPPDDPLYGSIRPPDQQRIYLGNVALHGERGLLTFSADWLIRQRHNPFYDYLQNRIMEWVEQAGPGAATGG
jgi:alpha-beta hydrolase superfamily lysophospholipase